MFRRRTSSFLAAAVVALAAAACADQPEPTDFGDPLQASASQAADIFAVQARHTPGLMARDGILGTGIRQIGAQQSIVVYAVSPSHAAAARVPDQLDGYNVNVVVTGRIDAIDYNNPQTKERPAPSGFSVGHPDITAGTIGAIVNKNGNTYILSNNHVIANSNAANIGDPTLQPGTYDGGTLADQIGTLADFEVIIMGGAENRMDAAIALVNAADVEGATPTYAYGAPTGTLVSAFVGQNVQKFGRTTGHTFGVVQETNLTVSVCYKARGLFMCEESATFTGQIGISDGNFSAGGDSGSLIVDSSKNPVGLLFAGSSTRTIANPIGEVMTRFGVTIGKGDGSGGGTEPPPPSGDDTTAPSASFTYSCSNGGACSFTDTSTDNAGVTSWSWTFGNGQTSTQQNPSTTYNSAGSYTVTLTAGDAAGNTGSTSRTISCSVRGKNLKCS